MKLFILSLLCYLAAVSFNFSVGRLYPAEIREDLKIVPSKEIMEILSLDHRGFAADYLFAKVNVHSGSLMWKPLEIGFDSRWSFGTMDLITDLDPKYYTAYIYSGMGLIHAFDDARLARPIIEKGMLVFPESWELPFWIGYDHYVYLEDYETASEYFLRAARKPGAPTRFLAMLLDASRRVGAYESAYWALKVMMAETEDEKIKKVYEKKLRQLDNLLVLQKAVKEYEDEQGLFPAGLDDLVAAQIIPGLPIDPLGMGYSLDSDRKRVVLSGRR